MNLQQLLPIASQFLGRDLTTELNTYQRSKAAIAGALNHEGQAFLQQYWPGIPDFLETQEGRKAVTDFLDAWVVHLHDRIQASLPKASVAPVQQIPETPPT